jgi:iron complex transport system ATP-binding protein
MDTKKINPPSRLEGCAPLVARDLCVTYPGNIHALKNVSVEVKCGEFVALIGPNGSGKSTLLRCLAGLMSADSGSVTIDGISTATLSPLERARRVAYVQSLTDTPEYMTAREFAVLGRYAHLSGWRIFSKHDYDVADGALQRTGAAEFADRFMTELSNGERQRVMLARALAQEASILLLDEPTSALDARHLILTSILIRNFCEREGKTVVAATHDLNLASQFADRLYLLNAGALAAHGNPAETLTKKVLESVYDIEVAHGYFTETIDGTPRPWVLPKAPREK